MHRPLLRFMTRCPRIGTRKAKTWTLARSFSSSNHIEVPWQGQWLRACQLARPESKIPYEFVQRTVGAGVVAILPVTPTGELILVEQYRPVLDAVVLEVPAGLVDSDRNETESPLKAAQRELLEETGYAASGPDWHALFEGPSSSGLTDETIQFYLATNCTKRADTPKHKEEGEDIRAVRLAPVASILDFVSRETTGRPHLAIDPKIFIGAYFCQQFLSAREID